MLLWNGKGRTHHFYREEEIDPKGDLGEIKLMKQFEYLFNKLFQHVIKYMVVYFHDAMHAAVYKQETQRIIQTKSNKFDWIMYRHHQKPNTFPESYLHLPSNVQPHTSRHTMFSCVKFSYPRTDQTQSCMAKFKQDGYTKYYNSLTTDLCVF